MNDIRRVMREARLWALEAFASSHPHECYERWPWRFWIIFHRKCPNISKDEMVQILKDTE